MKLLEKISSLNGVSANEKNIKKVVREYLKDADEILEDKMGGIFGVYGDKRPTLMVCAHMDEVGAMVVDITNDGFIKMINIGGINPESFVSTVVNVETNDGKLIKGVVSSVPPHISKNNNFEISDLLVDIGAQSKEEVLKQGIEVGSSITFEANYFETFNGKRIVNKSFDDRAGVAIILEIIEKIKEIKHDNKLVIGATVQEEVGLRGAKVATQMVAPDLFITVDVSPMLDYLGKANEGKLSGGFLVRYYDPGCIMPLNLRKYIENLANANNIKYQLYKSRGGTDAQAAQYAHSGCLSTTIGVPGRYIHSPLTMIDKEDLEHAKNMVIKIIEDFNSEKLKELLK